MNLDERKIALEKLRHAMGYGEHLRSELNKAYQDELLDPSWSTFIAITTAWIQKNEDAGDLDKLDAQLVWAIRAAMYAYSPPAERQPMSLIDNE